LESAKLARQSNRRDMKESCLVSSFPPVRGECWGCLLSTTGVEGISRN
ncbi:hypothetical protein chiPu_0023323, partial [Chiloscyllium punctatum]|nr:hypothetical protein [Chiloscyllium punctatum]